MNEQEQAELEYLRAQVWNLERQLNAANELIVEMKTRCSEQEHKKMPEDPDIGA